jgi:hypothetical protein
MSTYLGTRTVYVIFHSTSISYKWVASKFVLADRCIVHLEERANCQAIELCIATRDSRDCAHVESWSLMPDAIA